MRLVKLLVDENDRPDVESVLGEYDLDYVVSGRGTAGETLVEFPVPTDGVGEVLDALDATGEDAYVVIQDVETARTPHAGLLKERYAEDFDPLTSLELHAKARDVSQDPTSFHALMLLSTVIATAGLLAGSPAIVVGSMVIAPIVGPALTAGVGAVTGDRRMAVDSIGLQASGLALSVVGAALFAAVLRLGGVAPAALAITSLDLLGVRVAPSFLALVVGVAAGSAAAFGLTTEGPTSLIGVMIAAALVPTVAASGTGLAWVDPVVATGTLLLLLSTIVAINVATLGTLVGLGYRPQEGWIPRGWRDRATTVGIAAVIAVLVLTTVAASANQVAYERQATGAADDVLAEHDEAALVTVSAEYRSPSPYAPPETVTVVVASHGEPPDLADDLDARIAAEAGGEGELRVQFVEYETPDRST